MGSIAEQSDEACNKQIMRLFLNDKNESVLSYRNKNNDIQNQVNMLARSVFGNRLQIVMEHTPEGLNKAIVKLKNGFEITYATSKSYRYAKKKAGKEALRIISNLNLRHFEETSDYYERLQKRINEEKQKHQESVRQKNEEREKARLIRKEKVKRLKEIQDEKRRLAKLEAKKRKAEKVKLAAQAAAKSQRPLSAKKRRHLEDKKK